MPNFYLDKYRGDNKNFVRLPIGDYPYGRCEVFAYTLPHIDVPCEEIVVWDRNIRHWNNRFYQPAGVYIWHENQHDRNTPIYVGQSSQLFERIWMHCHPQDRHWGDWRSVVWGYIRKREDDEFEPCSLYPHGCDCLLRYNVRMFVMPSDADRDSVEMSFIKHLHPLLNKAGNANELPETDDDEFEQTPPPPG